MSGYGKAPQETYGYGYAATRPNHNQIYASLTQPSFASQYSPDAQPRPSHEHSPAQMPYIPPSPYQPRDAAYSLQYSTFIDARSRHLLLPQILDFSPKQAVHGAKLTIQVQTTFNPSAERIKFGVMFNQKAVDAALLKMDQAAPYFNCTLESDIPTFESLAYLDSPQIPLQLEMQDEEGQRIGVVPFGDFVYGDASDSYRQYTQPQSRKRKFTPDQELYDQPSTKRVMQQDMHGRGLRDVPGLYESSHLSASPPTPNMLASLPSSYYASGPERSPRNTYLNPASGSVPFYGNLSSSHLSAGKASSPFNPGYSSYNSINQHRASPGSVVGTPIGKPVSALSSSHPTLIRTSTIQPAPQVTAGAVSQGFNPYAMYPNSKAILKIDGNLDDMALKWQPDEWEAKRRLVQFQRSQTGSTITTTFALVAPNERAPNSICISCIWWEEKKECFVTSVDTIYLLESLVAVRFTVEEKNRIRRNLEGFRPLTVSKIKADSEEFFKIIMGFPNPKPRNIEKDVKVFPWKILSHALKKIISKYSASYSSTAGALHPGGSYGGGSLAEAGTGLHHSAMRRSISASMSAIPSMFPGNVMSPPMRGSGGYDSLSGGHVGQWQTSNSQQAATAYESSGISARGGAGSVDYAAFLTEPGATAASTTGTSQSTNLQRADVTAAPEATGGGHTVSAGGAGGHYEHDFKMPNYGHRTTTQA